MLITNPHINYAEDASRMYFSASQQNLTIAD